MDQCLMFLSAHLANLYHGFQFPREMIPLRVIVDY